MRVGKSNLIHLLTGKDVKVEISNHRVTTKVEAFEGIIDNKKVLYINTVGFSDENDEKEEANLKIFLKVPNFKGGTIMGFTAFSEPTI